MLACLYHEMRLSLVIFEAVHSEILHVTHDMYKLDEHKGGAITHTPLMAYNHDDEKFADAACLGGGEFVDMTGMRTSGGRGKSKKASGKKRSGQSKRKRSKKTTKRKRRAGNDNRAKPGGRPKRKRRIKIKS